MGFCVCVWGGGRLFSRGGNSTTGKLHSHPCGGKFL